MSLASELTSRGAVAIWWCEETSGTTMVDSSGNSHDGTVDAAVTLNSTAIVPNRPGGSWDLDAIGEGGSVPTNTWINGSAMTALLWIKLDTLVASPGSILMARANVGGSNNRATKPWVMSLSANGALSGRCYSDTAATAIPSSSNGVIAAGTLYLVAIRQDASNVQYVVNGVQVATSALAGGPVSYANSTQPITVGKQPSGLTFPIDGKVKAAAYFTSFLSDSDLLAIYNAGIASGETVNGGLISEASTVFAGVATVAMLVTGGLVTEANTVHAGTVTAGTVVTGGLISESNTVHAGTTIEGVIIPGGLVSESNTVHAGTTIEPVTVNGGLVAESNSVHAGTAAAGAVVGGGLISETTTVLAGSVVDGDTVAGGLVSETSTVHAGSIDLGYTLGDTGNAADGLILDGTGVWFWSPSVVEPPTGPPGGGVGGGGVGDVYGAQHVVAQAFPAPTIEHPRPHLDATYKREPRLRQRVVIHGQDVTYFRGYPTVIDQLSYMEPFLYGSAVIRFPQLVAPFAEMEQADNSWNAPERIVSIESVDADNNVVGVDFKGRVSDINYQGTDTILMVGGEVRGPAATRWKSLPLVPYRHDASRLWHRMLNNLGVVARPLLGVDTGYILGEQGPGWMLELLEEGFAQAWTLGGRQWTNMPDEDGIYRTFLKDNTTVHATAYPDGSRVVVDLQRSITDEHNRVFGRGVRKDGMVINNGVYGGMIEGDVPAFPGTLSEGDSGDDVTVLIHRLRVAALMNADEAAGGFDADVVDAVEQLQRKAGLPETGVVNNATWRALWDLDVTGATVRGAQIVPLAQQEYTREWFHSGGGAFTSLNPAYDPSRQVVDLYVDFGANQRRNQMVRRAKAELANAGPHYTGTITLTEGALPAGDHTPGDPITTLIHDRELRPGMNIKIPTMLGDRLLHVSGIDRRGLQTTLAVDTKFRDAVPVWKIHQRNQENRQNLNRWGRGTRSSGIAKDSIGEWSEVGGINDRRRDLIPGEWIHFEVISGPSQGTIRDFEISCGSGVEFAVAVFGSRMNAARMNNLIPNPLTPEGYERWKDPDIRQKLRDRNILYSAGVEEDPCGYFPDKKSEGASIITGDWFDENSWSYFTAPPFDQAALVDDEPALNDFGRPVLYVCVYANASGYVRPGRMFKPQGESGV